MPSQIDEFSYYLNGSFYSRVNLKKRKNSNSNLLQSSLKQVPEPLPQKNSSSSIRNVQQRKTLSLSKSKSGSSVSHSETNSLSRIKNFVDSSQTIDSNPTNFLSSSTLCSVAHQ
jgi:hypothetical protein